MIAKNQIAFPRLRNLRGRVYPLSKEIKDSDEFVEKLLAMIKEELEKQGLFQWHTGMLAIQNQSICAYTPGEDKSLQINNISLPWKGCDKQLIPVQNKNFSHGLHAWRIVTEFQEPFFQKAGGFMAWPFTTLSQKKLWFWIEFPDDEWMSQQRVSKWTLLWQKCAQTLSHLDFSWVESQIAASNARQEAVESLTHELKTPLAALEQILLPGRHCGASAEKVDQCLTRIRKARELVHNYLDFVRLGGGGLRPVGMDVLIKDIDSTFRLKLEKNNIKFTHNLADDPCHVLMGNRLLLHQVLANLMDNAISALGDKQKKEDQGRISLHVTSSVNNVSIIFADNGPGVPAAIRSKMFQPFVSHSPKDDDYKNVRGHGPSLSMYIYPIPTSLCNLSPVLPS